MYFVLSTLIISLMMNL